MNNLRFLTFLTALTVPCFSSAAHAAETGAQFYTAQVLPLLQNNCVRCHEAGKTKGGLRLDSREALLKGGDSGAAVDLKAPAKSLLLKAISHTDADLKMPPSGKLTQAQIAILTKWVELGVPFAATSAPAKHGPPPVNAETKKWWSFQPVKSPAVPPVKNKKWPTGPIDNFILARLEKAGFAPSAPVGKEALLRRAAYDLTGLPPTPDEVKNFVADKSPDAYEKLIDRLLASPQYGERWGRHWLDLVRYAESNSFERDDTKPFVWRYRDYVIDSLNADKPYDEFLREQLAGDEIAPGNPQALIATGFYRLGQWDDEPVDAVQARYDELDDIVTTAGQTMLGLTVNCARCHDHKIDPIQQRDYYRFLAFFQGTTRFGLRNADSVADFSLRSIAPKADQEKFAKESAEHKARLGELTKQLTEIEKPVEADFIPVEKEEFRDPKRRPALLKKRVPEKLAQEQFDKYLALTDEKDKLQKSPPKGLAQALVITETGKELPKTHILMRGSPQAPGDEVKPGFLSVLSPPEPAVNDRVDGTTSGRRTVLANWIADAKNPLTARVMVNRIWQHHFGRGIVRSTSNFGFMGTPPTHPELLDYLADEFVKGGWKLKPLHKAIMLSSAYRMTSQVNAKTHAKALAGDPENDLFWRFDMRRLDAEEVRDSILAANGSLKLQMGGPSIYPTIPREVLAGQSIPGKNWHTSKPEDQARRSVYIHVKRSLTVPLLASFDAADTDTTCPVRFTTTQPTQALSLLNSTFTAEQSKIFADDLKKQAGPELAAQVRLGLLRVLQREPAAKEIERGVNFVTAMQKEEKLDADEALRFYCVVLLNLNEFIYLD